MDRRSWPWKKKGSAANVSSPQECEFKQNKKQLDSTIDLKDPLKTSDAVTLLQQADARLKILSDQLTAKDELVQQHAKVAEDAVAGWEKAESEAASKKDQLDAEIQKNIVLDDRLSHMDGALKECMRQLRQVREEQEHKTQETVMKKAREWEVVREGLEAKMAKMADELLEAGAEKVAMSKTLQERARTIREADEGRGRAEAEMKVLQVRVELAEKEQAKWRYELNVLSKELEIRNEELEFNKKAADAASKQHLENVKKITKLEAECQRLRLLVRKRLPGPAALAQMRTEVEALGTVPLLPAERGRRLSPSRRAAQPPTFYPSVEVSTELSDRLLAMQKETKALNEALIRKDGELHAARLLCARTARRLSAVEERMETVSRSRGSPMCIRTGFESSQEPSVASVSEDGGAQDEINCSESWATALITELAQFRKSKGSSIPETTVTSASCELMDDFAEMEKLASIHPEGQSKICEEQSVTVEVNTIGAQKQSGGFFPLEAHSASLQTKEDELNLEDTSSDALKSRLSHTEDELNAIKLENLAVKAALATIEKHLVTILEAQAKGRILSELFEEARVALDDLKSKHLACVVGTPYKSCLDIGSPQVRDAKGWSPGWYSTCQSEESMYRQDITVILEKASGVGPELANAVHKVVCLVEAVSQLDDNVGFCEKNCLQDKSDSLDHIAVKQGRSSELDACVESVITLCNGLLHGKVDNTDFLAELASVLEWLVSHIFTLPNKSTEINCTRRRLDWDARDSGTATSLASPWCKSSSGCNENASEAATCSVVESPDMSEHHKDPDKIQVENKALAVDLEMHKKKVLSLQEELSQLKSDKKEADNKLKVLMEELQTSSTQLQETKVHATNLQSNLTSVLESKKSLLNEVADLVSSKKSIESQLDIARVEVKKLEEKTASLYLQLQDEIQNCKDAEAVSERLQKQHINPTVGRRQAVTNDDEPNIQESSADEPAVKLKEQEIAAAAEKLAECQQTILVLGKQLKALGMPAETEGTSCNLVEASYSPTEVPVSHHRLHTLSDQLSGVTETNGLLYLRGVDSPSTSPMGCHQQRGDGKEGLEHQSSHTESGHGTLRLQNGGTKDQVFYGPQLSPDGTRVNGIGSSYYHDIPHTSPSSPGDPMLTSPARSPSKFPSLRSRGRDSKSGASSEKVATGFSRFFSKNKSTQL